MVDLINAFIGISIIILTYFLCTTQIPNLFWTIMKAMKEQNVESSYSLKNLFYNSKFSSFFYVGYQ